MAVYGAFEPGSFNAWTLNLFADVFVNPGVARGMQVTAPGGMQVQLTLDGTANDGVCYLPNGGFIRIDTVQTFPVPNNSSGGTRTDAVVAFVDPTGISNPSFSLTYVTNWSSAFAPGNNNQLVIALVSVPNGAVSIATGNITNNPNAAKLTGTAGSNSMVAADGIGLTVQDNTSSATLSVVLTGLTNGAGRSIAIQTTDISAIGHQSTFDQAGNLILSGSLTTYGRNTFNAVSPLVGGPSAYDTLVLSPNTAAYRVNIGAGDGSFGGGIGLYAYDAFNNGFIFQAGTKNGITFPVTSLFFGGGWNGPHYSSLSFDPINRLNAYWVPQTGSTALGHTFVCWDGVQQRDAFSIGGNFGSSTAWVDNAGNLTLTGALVLSNGVWSSSQQLDTTNHIVNFWPPSNNATPWSQNLFGWNGSAQNLGVGIQPNGQVLLGMIRNNAATAGPVPIYTGTSNPNSPPTGSVWVKA